MHVESEIELNLSVVMPVRNGELFIDNALGQIQKNISPSDEVIVIDDGSEDSTLIHLDRWLKVFTNLRVIRRPKIGLVEALNLGIIESKNTWIARFDVDDIYDANRLNLQRKLIYPGAVAIFCDYRFFMNSSKNLGIIPTAILPDACALSLISSQRSPHPGVIFNKDAAVEVGMYRGQDFPAEDFSLWLRLNKVGKLHSVPEVLLQYRLSSNSVSQLNKKAATKKRLLITSEIGIGSDSYESCLSNWWHISSIYDKNPLANERKILLLRDIKLYTHHFGKVMTYTSHVRKIELEVLKNFSTYSSAMNLYKDMLMRKAARLFI